MQKKLMLVYQSWASLVDKSALDEIPPAERKRQEVCYSLLKHPILQIDHFQQAIFELIATEAAYVRDLQLIVEVFYSNLLSILDEKAITVIFANVEDILLTNTVRSRPSIRSSVVLQFSQTLLSSLEERQKECRLYIDRIGDILKNNMAHMNVYMVRCLLTSLFSF